MSDFNPPPPPPPTGGFSPEPASGGPVAARAGFGPRFLAALLDGLVLGVPMFLVNLIVRNAVPTTIEVCVGDDTRLCEVPTGAGWAVLALFWAASIVVFAWYFGSFEGVKTQTIGKKALNIRVVDATTGNPIGMSRGVGRYFARFVSAIPCGLGYFWMLWDSDKETWHDKMTTSRVVTA